MNILLVNDDGIHSEWLALICRAAAARGHRVTVSAPKYQQSAKSHAFTLATPLMAQPVDMEGAVGAWSVDGTPVDCCRVGMMCLSAEKPDLVISGINYGWNAGLATYVSGTVGAAREAAFQEIPALAVSMEPGTPEDTAVKFADYAVRTGEKLVNYPMPPLAVCNLNAPKMAAADIKGAVMCPISTKVYKDGYEQRQSPRGDLYFWLEPETLDDTPALDSDFGQLYQGNITVTFLTVEGCSQHQYDDFPLPW